MDLFANSRSDRFAKFSNGNLISERNSQRDILKDQKRVDAKIKANEKYRNKHKEEAKQYYLENKEKLSLYTKGIVKCQDCNRSLTRASMQTHRQKCNKEDYTKDRIPCPECGTYIKKESLVAHNKTKSCSTKAEKLKNFF